MTRRTSFPASILALILAFALSTPLFAQTAIGIDEALTIARAQGMTTVAKLEHEHEKGQSLWEAEGLGADGKKMEIKIDALTGNILKKQVK
ncbi:MAG: Propeptide PepSY amd peptidase [Xanthobacteraceae bacterium]|nr:Propeptide PepSY amd peptidase [Xanthobacteraceae bacterium]